MNKDGKILVVVQARSNSSRLKDKIFLHLCGKELLMRQIERIEGSCFNPEIVVATTCKKEDDKVIRLCEKEGKKYFRGSENDLLDRHFQAGVLFGADVVVKIPSDCPLIDTNIIDKVLKHYINNCNKFDYVSNLHPATYPDGNDVEVMSIECLERAWEAAEEEFQREHTTPFIWDNPEMFRIGNVKWESGEDLSMTHRFTIDYNEDYKFIKAVYEALYPVNPRFSLEDILRLLKNKPGLLEINKIYNGVNWYRKHLQSLKTVTGEQTRII
jgi:spore coat polysaccharide biosynthesis protein SpsF